MSLLNMNNMIALHHYRPAFNGNINDTVYGFRHPPISNHKTEVGAFLLLLVHTKYGRSPFQRVPIGRSAIVSYALLVIELFALVAHGAIISQSSHRSQFTPS